MIPTENNLNSDPSITPSEALAEVVYPAEQPVWYLSDGLAGEGDVPAWFYKDKYKTVKDQARAYAFLEKKLGAFQGAPEQYQLEYPADFPEECKVCQEDPLFLFWSNIARKHNMSNALFSELYLSANLDDRIKSELFRQRELEKLGPDAEMRLERLVNWAKNNLNQDELEALQENLQTSRGLALFEKLISLQNENHLPKTFGERMQLSQSLLDTRVADPRYKKDADFRQETSRMFEELYGR